MSIEFKRKEALQDPWERRGGAEAHDSDSNSNRENRDRRRLYFIHSECWGWRRGVFPKSTYYFCNLQRNIIYIYF